MRQKTIYCLAIASCLFLSACSSSPISIFPTKINAHILASHELNPDSNNRPSPLVVRIYELKSNNTFSNAGFFSLYDQEAATLGGELISREEFELAPGQGRKIKRKPHDETRFFGVIAAYRNIDAAQWRAVTELRLNKTNDLSIHIGKDAVQINHK